MHFPLTRQCLRLAIKMGSLFCLSWSVSAAPLINEIMYHPAHDLDDPEPIAEEFIEFHNPGTIAVSLNDWKITRGVNFTFLDVTIPANGFVVVAANLEAFAAKYGDVGVPVLGPWTGKLSNGLEQVRIEDAEGNNVDSVTYSDQGDWAQRIEGRRVQSFTGWDWNDEHDGEGASLELQNPALTNNLGLNWAASPEGGTPGKPNSVASDNVAPLITNVRHRPAIPQSNETVTIRADFIDETDLIDEAPTATMASVHYRVAKRDPGDFIELAMNDRGEDGDRAAGDGEFAATISAHEDGTVIEFYLASSDGANSRTWPTPVDEEGTQAANALYLVTDEVNETDQPLYHVIMTEEGLRTFRRILSANLNVQTNATFISEIGDDVEIRYFAGVRERGAGSRGRSPENWRVNLPNDKPWNNVTAMNLNTQYTYLQYLGAKVCKEADVSAADATVVQTRLNGSALVRDRSPAFGSRVHMEVLNGDWVRNHIGASEDTEGNMYSKGRPEHNWRYTLRDRNDPESGPRISSYRSGSWGKGNNEAAADWNDLHDFFFAMQTKGDDPNYLETISKVADIDQWVRYFAVMTFMSSGETAINTGVDDDYKMYRRGAPDGRFTIVPHDLDTVFGEGDGSAVTNPRGTLFPMRNNPLGSAKLRPFIDHPVVGAKYYAQLRKLANTVFHPDNFNPMVDHLLGSWVPERDINNIKDHAERRRAHVLSEIPTEFTAESDLALIDGAYEFRGGESTFSGVFDAGAGERVTLGGVVADLDSADSEWSIQLTPEITEEVLMPMGSEWSYLDDGSDQGTAWTEPEYDDAAWAAGVGPLGYGESVVETKIGFGPESGNKFITSYFRTVLDIPDPGIFTDFRVRFLRDDGIAVYVNGTEATRDNLPANAAFDTPASSGIAGSKEKDPVEGPVNLSSIRAGANTVAVEIHQDKPSSSDLLFDLEFIGLSVSADFLRPFGTNPGLNAVPVSVLDADGNEVARRTLKLWNHTSAGTAVEGAIATDTVFAAANSPYLVSGDLTVAAGATLTVEPGTTLFFGNESRLTVTGRLVAEGTEDQRIFFSREPKANSQDRWNGIEFTGNKADNRIAYAIMEFGDNGEQCISVNASRLTLDHVEWANVDKTILELTRPQVWVSNCTFPSLTDSEVITGNGLAGDDYCVIEGSIFASAGGASDVIAFTDSGSRPGPIVEAYDNTFHGSSDEVFNLAGTDAHIEGNFFTNVHQAEGTDGSSNAISASEGDLTIVRNVFYDVDHAVLLVNGSRADFDHNTVTMATMAAVNFDDPEQADVLPGKEIAMNANILRDNNDIIGDGTSANGEADPVVAINYSIVPEAFHALGTGNIDADPLFAGPFDTDPEDEIEVAVERNTFRLQGGSPAIGLAPAGLDAGALVSAGAVIVDQPGAVTPETTATLSVGGPGLTHYQFRLNGGAWSADVAIAEPINLQGLANGSQQVEVVGRNSAGRLQEFADATQSLPWTVQPTSVAVEINEVLADNAGALPLGDTLPDYIELHNHGATPANLAGLSISDDPDDPTKFVFPEATNIPANGHLILYADSSTQAGIHLEFSLGSGGEGVYLYPANAVAGTEPIDSIEFGLQIADHSIGRLGPNREWTLTLPTPGAANRAAVFGDPSEVVINEWLASPDVRYGEDFVELYNPASYPVDVSGMILNDDLLIEPPMHLIASLSFIGPKGYGVLDTAMLGFQLNAYSDAIALYDASSNIRDVVHSHGHRRDVSQGRATDGAPEFKTFEFPTPGLTNTFAEVDRTIIPHDLIAMDAVWKYDESGADIGDAWREPGFDDAAWQSGAALLYKESADLPGPKNTPLSTGKAAAYYVRHRFTFDGNRTNTILKLTHIIDDGAVFYLNGAEVQRFQMPDGTITFETLASDSVSNAEIEGPEEIPADALLKGENVFAAEMHQKTIGSSDVVFGMSLEAEETMFSNADPAYENALELFAGLRISEIMYNPVGDAPMTSGSPYEFLELVNISDIALDLGGVRFTDGIGFVFPEMSLQPGANVLIVKDRTSFRERYGVDAAALIAGEYTGSLSNGGETIVLQLPDPLGAAILRFRYDDAWQESTDGGGRSLEFTNFSAEPRDWNDRYQWAESAQDNGTPGGDTKPPMPTDTFASWRAANGVGSETEDDDLDGILNLMEYALDLDPVNGLSAADAASLPELAVSNDGNSLGVEFLIPKPARTDVIYHVEGSTSLSQLSWRFGTVATKNVGGNPAWLGLEGPVTESDVPGGKVSVFVTIDQNAGENRYFRLRVSK
jgi:hypothetical protein